MAKQAMLKKEEKKKRVYRLFCQKRDNLLQQRSNKEISLGERMNIQLQLSKMPRNASKIRQRNRCSITGRPRGYYRQFGVSRIMLRELTGWALLSGVTKSSW